MTNLTFFILYHRTLKNKSSDRILIEIRDILKDNRFDPNTKFTFENNKVGIIIVIDFASIDQKELYLNILNERDFHLAQTLMDNY